MWLAKTYHITCSVQALLPPCSAFSLCLFSAQAGDSLEGSCSLPWPETHLPLCWAGGGLRPWACHGAWKCMLPFLFFFREQQLQIFRKHKIWMIKKELLFQALQYFSVSVLRDLVYNLGNGILLLYAIIHFWCTLGSHYKEGAFSLSIQARYLKIALKQFMNSAMWLVTPVQDGPANKCRITFWGHVYML